MLNFRKASWDAAKIADCKKELDNLFFEAVGKGEKRMNPRATDILNKDRVDIAETIVNLVQQEVENVNPLPMLVEEVTGDIRNDYTWQELDGSLRVVDRSYGSRPLSQRLQWKEYSMKTSMKEVAFEANLEEIFAGKNSPSLAANEMALAITRYRTATVLDALDAAIPAVADRTGISGYNLRYSDSGSVTQASIDKALDGLQDEGLGATIIGRHTALYPALRSFTVAQGVTDRSVVADDELFARGVVGQYHGAGILELRDPYAKRSADHLIRRDKVWISSGVKGARFMSKPVNFLNYAVVDVKNATFSTGVRLEDGLLVFDPYVYRIITIT